MMPLPMAQLEAILQVLNFHNPCSAPPGLSSVHLDQSFWHTCLSFPRMDALCGQHPHLLRLCKHNRTMTHLHMAVCSYFSLMYTRSMLKCAKSSLWLITETRWTEHAFTRILLKKGFGTSLVAQWLRIRLPMQGTRVRALVWEDPTCHGAAKPVRHNYWACALEPTSHNYWSLRA